MSEKQRWGDNCPEEKEMRCPACHKWLVEIYDDKDHPVLWVRCRQCEKEEQNPGNCQEIIIAYLRKNGCYGLATDDCGCGIDDLIPCGEDFGRCRPAKKEGEIWVK
ncbi:MAG: hypothetical protein U1D67_04245 [Dehalococcoidia bacterium]|nr:hypothetical protein [Dehalococcoidia bacterium]